MDYASFLEIILADEVNRRAHRRIEMRLQQAGFQEICRLEDFDWSAWITLDRRLLDAAFSLEFLAKHEHVCSSVRREWARASWPRPWATPPSGPDTPSASAMLTTTSGR